MKVESDYYRGRYRYLRKIIQEMQKQDRSKTIEMLDRIRESDDVNKMIEDNVSIYIIRG